MISRRKLMLGSLAVLAAPAILTHRAAWAAGPRVRRNASLMSSTDPFFSDYAQAVEAMHALPESDMRNWRNQALIHINHCTHGTADFAHWHRWYLSYFEKICGELIGKPDFALAYWDWQDDNSKLPSPFFEVNFLDPQHWQDPSNAQSDNWGPGTVTTVGARGIATGQTITSIPQFANAFLGSTLANIRSQTSFEFFTGLLEGQPHNNAHVAVGSYQNARGHMGNGMSPLDPIFWLHHCNVDRFWAEWQAVGNVSADTNRSYKDNFIDQNGALVADATSTQAMSLQSFDYIYDTLQPAVISNAAVELDLKTFSGDTGSLFSDLALTAPEPIGESQSGGTAKLNIESRVDFSVGNLLKVLSDVRVFQAIQSYGDPLKAVESRRILAKIEDVVPPSDTRITVGAFVNCPYLSPDTPTYDPHCAGVFAFFGSGHGHHSGGKNVYLDLSDAIRNLAGQGRVAKDGFKLQLMAVPVGGDVPADTSVSFGKVTIFQA